MHLFAFLERSNSSQTVAFLAARSVLSFLYPPGTLHANPKTLFRHRHRRERALNDTATSSMDNWFINALVSAGTCHGHRFTAPAAFSTTRSPRSHHKPRRKGSVRLLHTSARDRQEAVSLQLQATREEYKDLVDQYGPPPAPTDPALTLKKATSRPLFDLIADQGEDEIPEASEKAEKSLFDGADTGGPVQTVIRLAKDKESPYEELFQAYRKLPSPGVALLPKKAIRDLLHRMSTANAESGTVRLRYLSLVDDMKEAGLPLTTHEWNSAVHLAGRSFKTTWASEVEWAIRIWKRMEHEAGIRGDGATFNILFDIAVKAGKFVLADMILAEMRERKLEPDSFTRTGLIYCEGAKGNGDGVRAAYHSLVEEGEIVDTAVLNCVIASLVRSGEGSAAELVFERMKRLNARFLKSINPESPPNLPPPPMDRKGRRDVGRALKEAAKRLRHSPELLQMLQNAQSLAPDLDTFAALITHHALSTGELDRVSRLLREMKYYGIPLNGAIFRIVLRGFSIHGGVRYSLWTRGRLESVWDAFWHAASTPDTESGVETGTVVQSNENVHLGKLVIITCLRAYNKCAGTGRMLEVWDEIKVKWDPGPEELEEVQRILGFLINERSRPADDWGPSK